MPNYVFQREARTPHSEGWTIELAGSGGEVGSVDIHFGASGLVHATLCVPAAYDEEQVEELIAEVDERLVLTTDPYRDDFIVTVWRGERMGVYSEEGEDEGDDTNGSVPHG